MLRFLKAIGKQLSRLGFAIGRMNTWLLITVSFYLLLFPTSLVRNLLKRSCQEKGWTDRDPLSPKHFEKQF